MEIKQNIIQSGDVFQITHTEVLDQEKQVHC